MLTNFANENNPNWLNRTAVAACVSLPLLITSMSAKALTADDVMNKMNDDQRSSFIAGVIGGLAYARFLSDRPDETGMSCIHDWYYGDDNKKNMKRMHAWFDKHLDKPIEPLLYVLIKKDCGT